MTPPASLSISFPTVPTKSSKNLTAITVDDHPIVRTGVRMAIREIEGVELVGEAADVRSALDLAAKQRPDLVVLDLTLGGRDGVELVSEMRRELPKARILIFSMNAEDLFAERALRAGANGYLSKDGGLEALTDAIRVVLDGRVYVSDAMNERLLRAAVSPESAQPDRLAALSDRELQVFLRLGQGRGTREIAEELCLSIKTISTYRENLKVKLDVAGAAELVREAVAYVTGSQR